MAERITNYTSGKKLLVDLVQKYSFSCRKHTAHGCLHDKR